MRSSLPYTRFLALTWLLLVSAIGAPATLRAQSNDFAFLGVYTDEVEGGLVVTYVYPDSSGADIGLLPGDRIIALNDKIIRTREVFVQELRANNIGAKVRFLIRREGEKLRLKGEMKGYTKTMGALQDAARERMVGKPLAKLPDLTWWNTEKKKFEEDPKRDALADMKGKIGILFAYDDCPTCTEKRYRSFANLQFAMEQTRPDAPIAFTGIYQSDSQLEEGVDVCLEHAAKLYSQAPEPRFAAAVAHFPKGLPAPKDRENELWLHNHGVVILEPGGEVAYLQSLGLPEREFLTALQKIIQKHYSPDASGASGTNAGGDAGAKGEGEAKKPGNPSPESPKRAGE